VFPSFTRGLKQVALGGATVDTLRQRDSLDELSRYIAFEMFRPEVAAVFARSTEPVAGRKPCDVVLITGTGLASPQPAPNRLCMSTVLHPSLILAI
jgi:hypothetical protein